MKTLTAHKIANKSGLAFQAMGITSKNREDIKALMATAAVKPAMPFARDDSHPSMIVVEFWSDDTAAVEGAIQALADGLGVTLENGKSINVADDVAKVA